MPLDPPLESPLENNASDVIGKAMKGHGFTPEILATQCALPLEIIHQALDENAQAVASPLLETIAITLHLCPAALVGLASYRPTSPQPNELTQIITPFYHVGVNAFIIRHGTSASLFDAGTDPQPILDHLEKEGLQLDAIYITHRHHDHVGGLSGFPDTPTYFADDLPPGEKKSLAPGIQLMSVETSGHYTPSRAYIISGLTQTLCICGDIIFAGSMGKTPDPDHYQQSLRHARENIMSLPAGTLICPGHGPLTTVGQETEHNPFLAQDLSQNLARR